MIPGKWEEREGKLLAAIDGIQGCSPALNCPLQIQSRGTDLRDAPQKTP